MKMTIPGSTSIRTTLTSTPSTLHSLSAAAESTSSAVVSAASSFLSTFSSTLSMAPSSPQITSSTSAMTSSIGDMTSSTETYHIRIVTQPISPAVHSPSSTPSTAINTLLTSITTHPFLNITPSSPTLPNNGSTMATVTSFPTTATTMPSWAIPEKERQQYLTSLQEETTHKLIPTLVFLILIAVIGFCGNIMVLTVYFRKPRRTATDIFIIAIAIFDLTTNTLAIPGEIYDTFHFWDFNNAALCKVRIFLNAFCTLTSAMALLAVAVTRYKKVCRPFGKQTTNRTAKLISCLIVVLSATFGSPQLIINGVQTLPTPRAGILGSECSIQDSYIDSIWPMMFAGFLMLLFLGICAPLIILYVLIGIQAWRHSKIHGVSLEAKPKQTPTCSENTLSETLDSEEGAPKKSHCSSAFGFLKKKQKYEIASHNHNGNELEATEMKDMTTKRITIENQLRISIRKNKTLESEESESGSDSYGDRGTSVKMMRSPTKDNTHVNGHMLNELNSKLVELKDNELPADSNEHGDGKMEFKEKESISDEEQTNNNESLGKNTKKHIVDADGDSLGNKEEYKGQQSKRPTHSKHGTHQHITFQETTVEHGDSENRESHQNGLMSQHGSLSRNATLERISKKTKTEAVPQRRALTRTTLMLTIISAVFVIAFMPHLIVISLKFSIKNFLQNMSNHGYATYNVFLRFYFLNSAANAIIYSLCDARFRHQLKKIFSCKK